MANLDNSSVGNRPCKCKIRMVCFPKVVPYVSWLTSCRAIRRSWLLVRRSICFLSLLSNMCKDFAKSSLSFFFFLYISYKFLGYFFLSIGNASAFLGFKSNPHPCEENAVMLRSNAECLMCRYFIWAVQNSSSITACISCKPLCFVLFLSSTRHQPQ